MSCCGPGALFKLNPGVSVLVSAMSGLASGSAAAGLDSNLQTDLKLDLWIDFLGFFEPVFLLGICCLIQPFLWTCLSSPACPA